MSDGTEAPSAEGLNAWKLEVKPGEARDVMQRILEAAKNRHADVLVVDGALVFGLEHIASAVFHARKAIAEGRNSSESLAMESLLYASGERQLSSAIRKMSVDDTTTSVVIAHLEGENLDRQKEWTPLPRTSVPKRDDLIRFGILDEELATVNPGDRVDLVLEKIAAVDILKK
ncbi:MAG: KEOPS complex subunit Cgi121 [Thermoplasmata archaeon]|nr:KEOPS complex subunit Cgi121 [Thermoplasmata archaeon]